MTQMLGVEQLQGEQAESSGSAQSIYADNFYPALHWELCNIRWFHPHMNRNTAQHVLLGTQRVGSYLLRNFSKGGPDDLAVSVRFPDDVKHFTILWQGDGYMFGKYKFDNLKKLLEHFDNVPLLGTADNTQHEGKASVQLQYPYPREVTMDDHAYYGDVVEHIEAEARPTDIHINSSDTVKDPQFEIRQKTGYLTKQGGRIKSWKTRWFVIQKHWMRYYVHQQSTSPRGIINLSKALDCRKDDSFDNGFTISVPKRVYYIQATNEEERVAWMEMITWKINYYNPHRERSSSSVKHVY